MKILFIILLTQPLLFGTPNKIEKELKIYKKVEFRSYFFHIYDLEVYTSDAKRPDFKKNHLFKFNYKKNISKKDLIDSTISEWDRLYLCKIEHAKKWGLQLNKIWPDIKKGDHIIAFFDGSRTIFYQQNKELGRIEGRVFSRAFFNIWLSKDSKIKGLN